MTDQELIISEYASMLPPVNTVIQTRSGPRNIHCAEYFSTARFADIRSMFYEAELRVQDNGPSLHKIHCWLKTATKEMMKQFRVAFLLYGTSPWNDMEAIVKNGASKKECGMARKQNSRQDDHVKCAYRLYEKFIKCAEIEQQVEERNSWYFRDYAFLPDEL